MAERESPALRALRRLWGDDALIDRVKGLMNAPSKINSAASDRAEHERQRRIDAEKLRQAEEDEKRRFPDK